MPGVTDSQLLDLIKATQDKYQPGKLFDVALKYNNYQIDMILNSDKITFDSGTNIIHDVQLRNSGAAKHVLKYESVVPNVDNVLDQVSVRWSHAKTDYSFERREIGINKGAKQLISLMDSRRIDAMVSMADDLEERLWSAPDDVNDNRNPFGIPYWVVKGVTAAEGFIGLNPSGFANVGGIDSSTAANAKWRNWSARGSGFYTAMNSQAIQTMRKAFMKIQFKSPFNVSDAMADTPMGKYRIFMNVDTVLAYEKLVEANNESLGRDGAPFAGLTSFRRNPVIHTAFLDDDATQPIYMLNFNKFKAFALEGDFMRESEPMNSREQNNVFTTFTDLTYGYTADRRDAQAVLSL